MPTYDYRCEEGHRFERLVPLSHFHEQQSCDCGALAARQVCAPMVISDYLPPQIGGDGKMHDSMQSWKKSVEGVLVDTGGEAIKPPAVDEKAETRARVEAIKAGIEDVKNGRFAQCYSGAPA